MRRVAISILIMFVFIQNIHGQLPIAFKEYRYKPKDTLSYKWFETLFSQNKQEEAKRLGFRLADSLFEEGNLSGYLFYMNQTGSYTFLTGKDLQTSYDTWMKVKNKMAGQKDTLLIEYVVYNKFLATSYYYQYDDYHANQYYKNGLEILKLLKIENELTADFYVNTGNTYTNLGLFNKALPYTEEGIRLSKKFNVGQLLMLANQVYGYIASFRDLNLALDFYHHIYTQASQVDVHEGMMYKYMANIDNALSSLYENIGDNENSFFYAKRGYENFEKSGLPNIYLKLSILNDLSYLASITDREAESLDYLDESFVLVDSLFGRENYNAINTFMIAIEVYLNFGKPNDAWPYVNGIKNLKIPEDDYSKKARYYDILADFYLNIDSLDLANEYYKKAVSSYIPEFDISKLNGSSPILKLQSNVFFNDLYPVLSGYQRAFKKLKFSDKKDEDMRIKASYYQFITRNLDSYANVLIDEKSGLDYSHKYQNAANRYIQIQSNLYLKSKQYADLENTFIGISKNKSFFLQKKLAIDYRNAQYAQKNDLWKKYVSNLNQLKQLENIQIVNSLKNKEQDTIGDDIVELKFSLLKQQLEFENGFNNEFPEMKIYNLADIQGLLSENEAILNYFFTDTDLLLLFISRNKCEMKLLGSKKDVEAAIKEYYKSIKTGNNKLNKSSQNVSDFLIKPFFDELKFIDRMIIIPHQLLFKLPFEPLIYENNKMLLVDKSIVYHYSTSLWAANKEKDKQKNEMLVAFAPVFPQNDLSGNKVFREMEKDFIDQYYNGKSRDLKELKYSLDEVRFIKKVFEENGKPVKIYTLKDATETQFRLNAKDAHIVHLATHGYVSERQPELSGFFFEVDNKNDDGYLFSGEIHNLGLQADLVVLSTCNSATGKIEESEGIMSLSRSIMYAGVPNIISSLWKVQDKSTKLLMSNFYKHYLSGSSYAEALRQAKMDCIAAGILPLDWSAFILIGE